MKNVLDSPHIGELFDFNLMVLERKGREFFPVGLMLLSHLNVVFSIETAFYG